MFLSKAKPLGELTKEHLLIMTKEGEMYHTIPADFKKSVEGFVTLWTTGNGDKLNGSPVQNMFHKLITLYEMDDDLAYSLCEHYVRIKVYSLIASVE